MLESSYRNEDKLTVTNLKKSHFKNIETKTKNWFLKNFLEKLFKGMISCTIKILQQKIPEQLYSRGVLISNLNEMP